MFCRLKELIGEEEWSLLGAWKAVGEPKEEDSDGGGTIGYVSVEGATRAAPGLYDDDGVVNCVLTLVKLAGTGESGKGDSDDEGELDCGVLDSEG